MNIKRAPVKIRFFFSLLVFFLAIPAAFSQDVPLPASTGFVNDFAGVMDPAVKQQLETRLKEFKEKTNPSVEIAVVTVTTTADRPIFDYSLRIAREWKIGSKDDDNPSALLLVAIGDRKYYTQVSRDLEDELPDGIVGSLQRQYLVPEFKQGNYSKGIADTVEAYIRTIEAKQSGIAAPTPATTPGKPSSGKTGGFSICSVVICLIVLFVIMIIIFGRGGRGKSGRDNDRWGGGGGFGSGGGSDIAGNVLAGVAGAVIGNILSGGGSSSGGSSGGSDWGGSSGGSDWGGFGGGGDFGGGGAGGDW
jgi:uncharacterized protein